MPLPLDPNFIPVLTQIVYVLIGLVGVMLILDAFKVVATRKLPLAVLPRSIVSKLGMGPGLILLSGATLMLINGLIPATARDVIRVWGATMLLLFSASFMFAERES
jgi:hypothetical protein